MIRKLTRSASDLTFASLALFVALFYFSIALEGGFNQGIQAVLAFAFVPVAFIWRARPVISSLLMILLLFAWSLNWIAALPSNLGLTPFVLLLPVAVFGVARNAKSKWVVAGFTALAFLYCVVSPIMWQPGIEGATYRSFDQAISWLLVQWLALSIVVQFGRSARRQELQREVERIAREQSYLDKLRKFQVQERLQVAREIHDVLAHSLTLINVQASAGEIAGNNSSEKSLTAQMEALRNIRKISSDSLVEVRGIVRALRDNTNKGRDEGLTDIRNICSQIERFSSSGLDVSTDFPSPEEMEQLAQSAPLITQLAIRRIIDESLTNALRHQGPGTIATVVMSLSCETNELSLIITSTSSGQETKSFEGTGSGLIGMEERVTNLGGSISFNKEDDVFRVTATLPIQLT